MLEEWFTSKIVEKQEHLDTFCRSGGGGGVATDSSCDKLSVLETKIIGNSGITLIIFQNCPQLSKSYKNNTTNINSKS